VKERAILATEDGSRKAGCKVAAIQKIIGHISFDISHLSFEKARTSIKLFLNDK
jgi:hypothetical protein